MRRVPNGGAATVVIRTITHFLHPALVARDQRKHQRVDMAVLPKKGDLSVYSDAAIQTIEDKLNRRPRKRSGYRMHFIVESAAYSAVG